MSVDLNAVAEKLKKQRNLGVDRDGRLTDRDPMNDGSRFVADENKKATTLESQRFFVS